MGLKFHLAEFVPERGEFLFVVENDLVPLLVGGYDFVFQSVNFN
jgi:hypothetical protein